MVWPSSALVRPGFALSAISVESSPCKTIFRSFVSTIAELSRDRGQIRGKWEELRSDPNRVPNLGYDTANAGDLDELEVCRSPSCLAPFKHVEEDRRNVDLIGPLIRRPDDRSHLYRLAH